MRTVEQLIEAAGGVRTVAEHTKSGEYAPYKWSKIGIPEKHWPTFIELAGATPDELFEANKLTRSGGVASSEATPPSPTPPKERVA